MTITHDPRYPAEVMTRDAVFALASSVLGNEVVTDGAYIFAAADVATEIAYRESGFDHNVHGVGPRDDSYGLWQINMLGTLGPDRRAKLGISNNEALYNPATNAQAMKQIFVETSGFAQGWTTSFTAAKAELRRKLPGNNRPGGGGAGGRVPTVSGSSVSGGNADEAGLYPGQLAVEDALGGGVASLVDAVRGLLSILTNPTFWRRLGIGAAGVALVIVALVLLTGQTDVGKAAKSVATKGLA